MIDSNPIEITLRWENEAYATVKIDKAAYALLKKLGAPKSIIVWRDPTQTLDQVTYYPPIIE